jgi:hypothetical protein
MLTVEAPQVIQELGPGWVGFKIETLRVDRRPDYMQCTKEAFRYPVLASGSHCVLRYAGRDAMEHVSPVYDDVKVVFLFKRLNLT